MNNTPRPETRLSELEAKMAIQDARIRELAEDTAEEFKALRQDIKHLDDDMKASFKQVGDMIMSIEGDIAALNTRFDEVNEGIKDLKEGLLSAINDLKK